MKVSFAAVGFALPWLLIVYYAIAHRMGHDQSSTLIFYVCPASIVSLALSHAPLVGRFFGWLLISASNAALYATLGTGISMLFRDKDTDPLARN
jgi:hypothetical protein